MSLLFYHSFHLLFQYPHVYIYVYPLYYPCIPLNPNPPQPALGKSPIQEKLGCLRSWNKNHTTVAIGVQGVVMVAGLLGFRVLGFRGLGVLGLRGLGD